MDDESETMTECSAAMLLMKLSCSPASAAAGLGTFMPSTSAPNLMNPDRPPSVDSSSGASSFRSSTPSPPLSSSATTDEGIIKDFPMEHAVSLKNDVSKIYIWYILNCGLIVLSVFIIFIHL